MVQNLVFDSEPHHNRCLGRLAPPLALRACPPRKTKRAHAPTAPLRHLLLAVLLLLSVSASAQRSTYRQYDFADGLTDMTIQAILQDRTGYIWVATDNGLFRYDGSRFVAFQQQDGLPESAIRGLAESPDGALWVATHGGIARQSTRQSAQESANPPAPTFEPVDVGESGVFRAVAFDQLGQVYVESPTGLLRGVPIAATPNYRFQRVVPGKVTGLSIHGNAVRFCKDNDLWQLTGDSIQRIGTPAGLPADRWRNVLEDLRGNLWAASATRLAELPKGQSYFVDRSAGLPHATLDGLYAGPGGRLYVSSDAGVTLLDPAPDDPGKFRLTAIDAQHGLPADGIKPVLLDREGSLWLGASGSGLIRQLGRGEWLSWKKEDGLLHNTIWGIHSDATGQLWIGSSGGLNLFDANGHSLRSWTRRSGLPGDEVYALAESPAGDIFASTYPVGISRFSQHGSLLQTYRGKSALATGWVLAMTFDAEGHLWTLGAAGCFRSHLPIAASSLHPSQPDPAFDRLDIPGLGPGTTFYDLIRDGDTLWVGSSRGLAHYVAGHWRVYTPQDGLKSPEISVIARAPDGLWIAYENAVGISRIQFTPTGLQVRSFSTANGLSSNKIFSIAADHDGRLWNGSDAGVDVLTPALLPPADAQPGSLINATLAPSAWRHYGKEDGLIWTDTDGLALEADKAGNIWIGTSAGLSRFHPTHNPVSAAPPTVVITSTQTVTAGVFHDLDRSTHPTLTFDQRSLVLQYSALTYADEARVRFRYRLVGGDPNWTETREHSIRFESLPAGNYVFEVIAATPGSPWSPVPAAFAFSIHAPWWQTWWFAALCLAIAALLVSMLWRLRVRVLLSQKNRLEQLVTQRTAELTESHRQLEQLAYHDTLTHLPNRRKFTQQLRDRLDSARTLNDRFALLLIDLDHFKQINDSYGHDAGDRVLVETAARLRAAVRESDCVARMGGDEFSILLHNAAEQASIEEVCARIVGDSSANIPFDGSHLSISVSVGVAVYPADGATEKTLFKAADVALYAAKQARSAFRFRSQVAPVKGAFPVTAASP